METSHGTRMPNQRHDGPRAIRSDVPNFQKNRKLSVFINKFVAYDE